MFSETIIWNFPGGWHGIISLSLILLILIALSYKFSLKKIPFIPAVILALFRISMLFLIIYCICGPSMQRESRTVKTKRPVTAIVFDESASMSMEDAKGKTRLEESVRNFNSKIAPLLKEHDLKFYAFSSNLRKLKSPEELLKPRREENKSTALYKNMAEWIPQFNQEGISGVICFSDGIDTSGWTFKQLTDSLAGENLTHIFAPAVSKLKSAESFEFERIESPSSVSADSLLQVTALARYSGMNPGDTIDVKLRAGLDVLYSGTFKVGSGNSKALNIEIPLKEAGLKNLELTAESSGRKLSSNSWSVSVLQKNKASALLYLGSADWGARFLKSAFDNSERTSLTIRFAQDILGYQTGAPVKIKDKTISAADLANSDLLILMSMRRHQFTPQMEKNLRDYVNNGGSILFMIANSEAAAEYSGTPVEKFLPVYFESIASKEKFDDKTQNFLKSMERYRANIQTGLNKYKKDSMDVPPLIKFKLPDGNQESDIFSYAFKDGKVQENSLPSFEDFALINREKPGAKILALNSEFTGDKGQRILLATQQFGKGRAALLATDSLWRWKLSSPSQSKDFDKFWESLILHLSSGKIHAPYWKLSSMVVQAGAALPIRLVIPQGQYKIEELQTVIFKGFDAEQVKLKENPDSPGEYSSTFTPAPSSRYTLKAFKGTECVAETSFSSSGAAPQKELSILKPDIPALQRLANLSGGAVLTQDSDKSIFERITPERKTEIVKREERPLWNNAWIFFAIFGLFSAELIIRRLYRLL